LVSPVVCDRCGIDTLWRFPRQSKRGRCLDHEPGFWLQLAPTARRLALRVLLNVLPGSTVETEPPRLSPEQVTALRTTWRVSWPAFRGEGPHVRYFQGPHPDAGPCALCRSPTMLYGSAGQPLCVHCEHSAGSVHSGPAQDGGSHDRQ